MDKDTKKDDRVTIRLPEELRNYEAFGFKNISEYIKAALTAYNAEQEFFVLKSQQILEEIGSLCEAMEAERDYGKGLSNDQEKHLEALYEAAKPIAASNLMMESSLNQVESPDPEEVGEKIYKYSWAL
jgi:Arc/MetJ-type ribon-helix-helix transcriptional regulator